MEIHILCLRVVVIGNVLFAWTSAKSSVKTYELEHLLDTHKWVADDLHYFIEKEEYRLLVLNNVLNAYKTEHWKAINNIPDYLSKPINAFTLIKRLTADLDHIEESLRDEAEYEKNITIYRADVKYPAQEDLTGAAHAIASLQEVYNLSARDLSEGKLNGTAHSTPMSAGDCYELGRALYNEKDFKHALPWMEQALRKLKDSDDPRPLSEADILEYISFLHYLLDDAKSALEWTKKLLKVVPRHRRAYGNIVHYENIIAKKEAKVKHEH